MKPFAGTVQQAKCDDMGEKKRIHMLHVPTLSITQYYSKSHTFWCKAVDGPNTDFNADVDKQLYCIRFTRGGQSKSFISLWFITHMQHVALSRDYWYIFCIYVCVYMCVNKYIHINKYICLIPSINSLFWVICGTMMHSGKKASQERQCDALGSVLLGNLGSCYLCGCYMYHLINHYS